MSGDGAGVDGGHGCADGAGWQVRPVAGAQARKAYRCPGCDQEILPGVPHVVAWPDGDPTERRHWHRVCWEARERRSARPRRPGRR